MSHHNRQISVYSSPLRALCSGRRPSPRSPASPLRRMPQPATPAAPVADESRRGHRRRRHRRRRHAPPGCGLRGHHGRRERDHPARTRQHRRSAPPRPRRQRRKLGWPERRQHLRARLSVGRRRRICDDREPGRADLPAADALLPRKLAADPGRRDAEADRGGAWRHRRAVLLRPAGPDDELRPARGQPEFRGPDQGHGHDVRRPARRRLRLRADSDRTRPSWSAAIMPRATACAIRSSPPRRAARSPRISATISIAAA